MLRIGDGDKADTLHLDQSIAENSVSRVVGDFAGPLGALDLRGLARQKEKGLSSMYVAGMKPENPAKSLSGGNQQKIVLIKWLASNPRILILNCPTVGVDVGAKSDIHETVRRLAADKGVGVIVISDDILEIMQLCNRVIIMKFHIVRWSQMKLKTLLWQVDVSLQHS